MCISGGGGIVADSEADAEYNETLDKASGLIAARRHGGRHARHDTRHRPL